MKRLILQVLLLFPAVGFAQIREGARVLTFSVYGITLSTAKIENRSGGTVTATSKGTGISLDFGIQYGKIHKNALFSYGIETLMDFNKSTYSPSTPQTVKSHIIWFGPVIGYEKFISISNHFFYSPYSILEIMYNRQKDESGGPPDMITRSFLTRASIHPFSMTFTRSGKTLFLFSMGYVGAQYQHGKAFFKPSTPNNETVSSSFVVSAQTSGIFVSVQRVF